MWTESKLTNIQKIYLCFLIFGNLAVGTYVLYSRQPETMPAKLVPAFELTENAIIRKRIDDLLAKNQTRQIAIALLTSASTSCSSGKVVGLFKKFAEKSGNQKFVVFLPNHFSQQDVENFKTNFDFNLEVEKADDELAREWLPIASKYEALGVVIVSDNGKLSVLQNMKEVEKRLANF